MNWLCAFGILSSFVPIYFVLRFPFFQLPLHIDSGFYVSNHTIAKKSFRFANGWNARYAGCSKVIPEYFYSLSYLISQRFETRQHQVYAMFSRGLVSVYNLLSAIIIGLASCVMTLPEPSIFLVAAFAYLLVSSEAQYGVYYENGELFEIPFYAASLVLFSTGFVESNMFWIASAACISLLSSYFIKLSSAIVYAVVFAAAVVVMPVTILPIVIGSSIATSVYFLWIILNRQSLIALLTSLWGHETACGQRANFHTIIVRVAEKSKGLIRVFKKQPLFPILAIAGLMLGPVFHWTVYAMAVGLLISYFFQASDCWYYRIPLLLPLTLFATNGIVALQSFVANEYVIFIPIICLWIAHNSFRVIKMSREELAKWVWDGHVSPDLLAGDLELEAIAPKWRSIVKHQSLFVYGSFNQAYILLDASYPTPIVAAERYLDDMAPGWQGALSAQLVASTPKFILDTGNVFEAATARNSLGLDYKLIATHGSQFRLFENVGKRAPTRDVQSTRTYKPQSAKQLKYEHNRSVNVAASGSCESSNSQTKSITAALSRLQEVGCSSVAVYGAGRFTARHADVLRSSPIEIAVILDDNADHNGPRFVDWPLAHLHDAEHHDIDAILVMSDRYAATMYTKAKEIWGDQYSIVRWDQAYQSNLSSFKRKTAAESKEAVLQPTA